MKKLTYLLLTLVASFFITGCSALKDWASSPSAPEQAYKAGKIATIAYLTQEEKLKEDQKKAVIAVYEAFDALMNEPVTTNPDGTVTSANLNNLKELLLKNLKDKLNDTEKAIVLQIIDIYIDKLKSDIDNGKLVSKEAVVILKSFHKGTKDALKEYKLITQ